MSRTLINELKNHIGEQVTIKGWLHTLRELGKVNFLVIRERTGLGQIVIESKEELAKVHPLQPGSILTITGEVKENSAVENGCELVSPTITVEYAVSDVPPIEYTKPELMSDLDTILDYRPLSLRNRRIQAVFRIQATMVQAYREFLISEGFTEFFGPNIISASSEGGTELFTVNYFDKQVKLSQSAQLYKQMMVGVNERVFALMKCFRAEKSNTRRHLTEATQFEFEMGFIESFEDILDMLERTVKYIVKKIQSDRQSELKVLGVDLAKAPAEVAFPRIKFRDALQLYFERTGIDERHEIDLSPAAEKELCAYAREKHGTDFIFVTHFLRAKTAFYAHPNEEDPSVTNYFDLLGREAEITSGGQRIHEPEMLIESLRLKGLDPADFEDYISIFKFGMPKHGGFGMGMERLTMMLLGLDNIREATLFPSDTKRVASVKLQSKIYNGPEVGQQILKLLKDNDCEHHHLTHEPTPTSEDAARVRDIPLNTGIKALILKNKKNGENIMACVSADKKLDIKALGDKLETRFEFEKPEVIKEKYGLEIGGIPPWGNLLGLKTYYHSGIGNNEQAAFNNGAQTESVIMKSADLIKLVEPEMF